MSGYEFFLWLALFYMTFNYMLFFGWDRIRYGRLPVIGATYGYRKEASNPFVRPSTLFKVRDVRNGWVQYCGPWVTEPAQIDLCNSVEMYQFNRMFVRWDEPAKATGNV